MSQWTHIRGCLELEGSAVSKKINKKTGTIKYYLPYPEEQLKLSVPKPSRVLKGKARGGIEYRLKVYCLPRCKDFVDKAMKLLPSGEHERIKYNLYQAPDRLRSSSSCAEPWEEKIFKDRILKQYQEEEGYPISWKEIKDYYNITIDWVDHATDFTLTISDDIRHCTGAELLVSLEKAFASLKADGITISDGILDWKDEWEGYRFQCKACWDEIKFIIYDQETGTILSSKTYKEIWNSNSKTFDKTVEQSENWNKFIPEVLYEQENQD